MTSRLLLADAILLTVKTVVFVEGKVCCRWKVSRLRLTTIYTLSLNGTSFTTCLLYGPLN